MFGADSPVQWSKCPPDVGRERIRQEALLYENSPDYLGLCEDRPGWRPRRTSFEDRRGVVPVTLAEVNSLPAPPVEPKDTTISSLCSEWLEQMSRQVTDSEPPVQNQQHPSDADDEFDWGYATDSTVDIPAVIVPTRRQSVHTSHSDAESEDSYFDTDTDTESDDCYDWSNLDISAASPSALANVPKWIIPRKRPSWIMDGYGCANKENYSCLEDPSSSESCTLDSTDSDVLHKQGMKRKPRKLKAPRRLAKKAKKAEHVAPITDRESSLGVEVQHHLDATIADTSRNATVPPNGDTPGWMSPARSTTLSVDQEFLPTVSRGVSPAGTQQVLPKPSKHGFFQAKQAFPCQLDGCTQVCSSIGDLMRHQQSLRHRPPEFICLGCQHAFTRPDALKRHLNSKPRCKGLHKAAVVDSTVGAQ